MFYVKIANHRKAASKLRSLVSERRSPTAVRLAAPNRDSNSDFWDRDGACFAEVLTDCCIFDFFWKLKGLEKACFADDFDVHAKGASKKGPKKPIKQLQNTIFISGPARGGGSPQESKPLKKDLVILNPKP